MRDEHGVAAPDRPLLLVDDDEANLTTLAALLELEGFEVDTATSCATARARLAGGRAYAAVLLDGMLGDGVGLDLVPSIRAHHPCASIVLVSGSVHETPEGGLVDAVIAKGSAFPELLAKLRELRAL